MSQEKCYPSEENLGKDCMFWSADPERLGCTFPNAKLTGRTGCEGEVDEICLLIKDGRRSPNIPEEKVIELKCAPPTGRNAY